MMAGYGLDLPGLEYRQVAGAFGCSNEVSGFCGMYKMSGLAQNLLVSQEGLCCLELVGLNGYLTGPELYLVMWQEMCQE
jgi:hypothetical protein